MTNPVVQLKDPLDIGDIIDGKFPQFSPVMSDLNEKEFEEDENMMVAYPEYFWEKFTMEELQTEENVFDNMRKDMIKLTPNGSVMKKIESEGVGEIPNYKKHPYVVDVYYAAYHEFDQLPFDLIAPPFKKPYSVVLGTEMVVPGFEIAIKSMKRTERAKFLVDPFLAYRDGVAPRIPKDATILFVIDLLNIRAYSGEEEEVLDFEKLLKKVAQCHEAGNQLKKLGSVNGAIQKYHKAKNLLLNWSFQNEDEETKANEKLILIYSNLAICYSDQKEYKKVCCMFNSAKYASASLTFKHVKLLYRSAIALRMLGNYDAAGKRITQALKIEPEQKELLIERRKLIEAKKNHRKKEMELFKNMLDFRNHSEEEIIEHIEEKIQDFSKTLGILLDAFLADDVREQEYDYSFSADELELCKTECRRRKIEVQVNESKVRLIKREL